MYNLRECLGDSKKGNRAGGIPAPTNGKVTEEGGRVTCGSEHDEGRGIILHQRLDHVPHTAAANRIAHFCESGAPV